MDISSIDTLTLLLVFIASMIVVGLLMLLSCMICQIFIVVKNIFISSLKEVIAWLR